MSQPPGSAGRASLPAITRLLLTAVTAVARGLKLRVCAQGVGSAAQVQLLERGGCAEFQGFHLGPPVPPATLANQLSPRGPKLAEPRR